MLGFVRPAACSAAALPVAFSVVLTLPAAAQLGVGDLFSNELDVVGDSASFLQTFHDERFAPNQDLVGSDFNSVFGFDYSGLTTGPAPGSSTTIGLGAAPNFTDDVAGESPERVALNYAPNVTIDSTTTDWVMTANAFAFNSGGASNTTLSYVAGMSASGTRANWQGGTDTDGVFWSLTTTGEATTDLLSFEGNTGAPATSFAISDIDGNPAPVDRSTPGTAGGWVTLAVGSHSNTPFFAIRTHQLDGTANDWEILETFDNTSGATNGNPFFGVEDPFNSANSNVGVVFDNVSVQTLQAGDTNFDGDVDFRDAMTLRRFFSGADVAADTAAAVPGGFDADLHLWTLGDFDQDRDVDFDDALALVGNYDSQAASISPVGTSAPLLVVNTLTGEMSLQGEATLSGVSITGTSAPLAGDESLNVTLASEAGTFTALALEGLELDGTLDLGSGFTPGTEDTVTFTYGVGSESFTGQVAFVPEPATAAVLSGLGLALVGRRRA